MRKIACLGAMAAALVAVGEMPAGYERLDYIETTGTQHIDTGIVPDCTDTFEMKMRFKTLDGTQCLWCSRTATDKTTLTCFLYKSKLRFDRNTGYNATKVEPSVGPEYIVRANYATLATDICGFDGGTMPAGDFDPVANIFLFKSHTNGTGLGNPGSFRFHSFKVTAADGTVRCEFVAARRTSDGVLGVYDIAGDAGFKTNAGTGAFVAGPVMSEHVWTGADGASLADAANWSPTLSDISAAGETLLVPAAATIAVASDVTVDALRLPDIGAYAITGSSANTLTVRRGLYSLSDSAAFGCALAFAPAGTAAEFFSTGPAVEVSAPGITVGGSGGVDLAVNRLVLGAGGITLAASGSGLNFRKGATFQAADDFAILPAFAQTASSANGLVIAGTLAINTEDDAGTGHTVTLGAAVSGSGKLTKAGAGTLILQDGDGASNTGFTKAYTGTTTVSAGTLRVTAADQIGTGAVTVGNGATLELAPGVTLANAVTLQDGATVVFGAGATIAGKVTPPSAGMATLVVPSTGAYLTGGVGAGGIRRLQARLDGAEGTLRLADGVVSVATDALPSGYQRLEYIAADGNAKKGAWIQTSVVPNGADTIEMRMRFTNVARSEAFWCAREGTTSATFTFFWLTTYARFDYGTGTTAQTQNSVPAATFTAKTGQDYTVVADGARGRLLVNGARILSYTPDGSLEAGGPLSVFGSQTKGTASTMNNGGAYRMYSFRVTDTNGVAKCDLVPAKRLSDGKAGAYDLVSGAFYGSQSATAFTAGPEVNDYTWIGGAEGNLGDAANWSPAPSGAFTAADRLFVTNAATVTVGADAAVGEIHVSASGAVTFGNPSAATTNTLTVARIFNAGSGAATFECAVQFADVYHVEPRSPVRFPGGARAKYPDQALAVERGNALRRTLDGHFTFTEDWTISACDEDTSDGTKHQWIVPAGSTVDGQAVICTGDGDKMFLQIDAGASASFASMVIGNNYGNFILNGALDVAGEITVVCSNSAFTVGHVGETGSLTAGGLVRKGGYRAYYAYDHLTVGAGGLGNRDVGGLFWTFSIPLTITTAADCEIFGEYYGDAAPYSKGLYFGAGTHTIDTAGHTVTFGAGVNGPDATLVKAGAGTLVMTNGCSNGHVGMTKLHANTTVAAGTLLVAADNSCGTGTITVEAGATLAVGANATLANDVVVEAGSTAAFTDGSAYAGSLTGAGTVSVQGDVTLADGAHWAAGAYAFAEGARVIVGRQSVEGVVATGVTREDYAAHFAAAPGAGSLKWEAGAVSYADNKYVWTGGTSGNWSDAANWTYKGATPATAPLDAAAANVEIGGDAAVTVTLDASARVWNVAFVGTAPVTIANPDAATTNTLTVAQMTQDGAETATVNCAVDFTDTWLAMQNTTNIVFAGGAVATFPEPSLRTASGTTLSRTLYGRFTFTNDWEVTTVSTAIGHPWILAAGSSADGRHLTGQQGNSKWLLQIEEGAYARFTSALLDTARGNVQVAGVLEVTGTIEIEASAKAYLGGEGYDGVIKANRIVKTGDGEVQIRQPRLVVGAGGLGCAPDVAGNYFRNFTNLTLTADADLEIFSPLNSKNKYDYGFFCGADLPVTIDTGAHTVTWGGAVRGSTRSTIIKTGAGTLVFTNGCATTGASGMTKNHINTIVSNGTLRVDAPSSCGLASGTVTVEGGATLAIGDGITISPNLTLQAGATVVFGKNAGVAAGQVITLGGAATVKLTGDYTDAPADADVVLGTLAEGADVSLVTADLTGLTLRPGRLAALVAENSRLLLRLTTPKGTTIVFR